MESEGFGYTKITVEDGLGPPVEKKLKNDFAVIVDGDYHVDGVNRYSNGTVQITLKRERSSQCPSTKSSRERYRIAPT